ncbi:MAG: NAD(P)H-dependent oxidoreductase [Bacteroidetes bacterium]|nr:NAD(P)H-dependent oxidoreductase [Bacteroidota bacterium]
MNRILIIFAHPRLEQSLANAALLENIPESGNITFNDLYELYPDYNIDTEREKQLLTDHNIIIWHHPFYWYSIPPLLKQWLDMVLEFKWAYGPGGNALKDKIVFNVITSGGTREVYRREGRNRFTVREFLAPLEQTAVLCGMKYFPPFAVQGTHKIDKADREKYAMDYQFLLRKFMNNEFKEEEILKHEFLNDWITVTNKLKV